VSIRILLADDHKIMREGLRSLLEKHPGVEVIAEADNGRAAVKLSREMKPDVVIMDITMHDLNGIEATRQIISEIPGIRVIGLSVHSDRQFVEGMLKAGASGYLLKDCAFQDVISAIQAAAANEIFLSPRVAGFVVEGYLRTVSKGQSSASVSLTSREREVLQLLAEGKSRSQVAEILHLSPRTVETHRREIMDKLDIHSTADLIKFAIREGLTSLEA
jgi:two-component system, NarL family, response regulator NreC